MKPACLKTVVLSGLTSVCLVVAPMSKSLAATEAPIPGQAESHRPVESSEPRLKGVGLIVSGSLLGVVAMHVAMFGGVEWLAGTSFALKKEDKVETTKRARITLFAGGGGMLVAGALLVSGIVLNQRYQSWKSRPAHQKLARRRVWPSLGWNGRTHTVGALGRF